MRVAITGASGFVGRHVLRELQARDVDIVVASRTSERSFLENSRTEILPMDIAKVSSDPYQLMGAPDVLVHLAWDGLPNYQSRAHIETELPTQLRFLEACLTSGLKRLVVTGTCFEYGMTSGEISESSETQPCTQYGAAKDTLRKHLEELNSTCPYQLAWLRLFYLYGPGQSKNSLYSLLTTAIQRGDTEFDMSGGEQVRDFLPIQEAARIVCDIALSPIDVGVVNVCSGTPTTVRELVEAWIVERHSSITMNLGRIPYSEIEPMSFWGTRGKLDAILEAL
ncbi:NAD(P)-dependent oxidoreductase [Rhodanobacter sp. C03]|uniref:NAD-dependent epimerase/dehydratase family protein n=1 Tax=Rhodanobacter sp. C03 TaxID=1945858 RepID=UPI000984153F|nr:NAD(P)-dependent oxidoreductase [Rhodanobacter sp. C03]OOG59661.1 epimerase [Rhodanobacter sp. C03]